MGLINFTVRQHFLSEPVGTPSCEHRNYFKAGLAGTWDTDTQTVRFNDSTYESRTEIFMVTYRDKLDIEPIVDRLIFKPTLVRRDVSVRRILKFFDFSHLPPQLQEISKPLCDTAYLLADKLPDGPELTAGLRKLLEAKDCFVRASLP